MRKCVLILSFLVPAILFAQMEEGSVWKLTGNAAMFLEQNNIDSTKVHFLANDVLLITYESAGNPYTETSTWTEPSNGSIVFTYDPSGFFFGNNCPTENTTFDYNVQNNSFTMNNVGGTCSIAQGLLMNSVWVKQGTVNLLESEAANFTIYPVPASTSLIINSKSELNLTIFDVSGNRLDCPIQSNLNHWMIDVTDLDAGVYFVANQFGSVKRFIVR